MKNDLSNNNITDSNNNETPRNLKIPFLFYGEKNPNQSASVNSKDENEDIPIFDLNKIFHINFSYNFDLLKNLLETLAGNQQEYQREIIKMKRDNEIKINKIENDIIDMKIAISNPQLVEELKKEKEKLKIESEVIKNRTIKEKNLEKTQNENFKQSINDLKVSRIET